MIAQPRVQDAYDDIIFDEHDAITALSGETGWTAMDLETSGLSPWTDKIAVVSLYGEQTGVSAVLHVRGHMSEELRAYMSSPDRRFVSHNATGFDALFLANNGVDVYAPTYFDTLVAEACTIVSQRRDVRVNLQDTLRRRLGVHINKGLGTSPWMSEELSPEQLKYCREDVMLLPKLRNRQLKDASVDTRGDAVDFEQGLAPVVIEMVLNGLPFDEDALAEYQAELEIAAREANARLFDLFGTINYNSPLQVKRAFNGGFEDELDEPLDGTSKAVMMELVGTKSGSDIEPGTIGQAAEDLLRVRESTKRTNMYSPDWVGKYLHDGRIHSRFWQVGTDTGRFSSSEPNLQQVPKNGRKIFKAPEGYSYWQVDYSKLEVLVAAVLSKDTQLLEDMEAGDLHTTVASSIFHVPTSQVTEHQRRLAKCATFTLIFVGSPRGLVRYAKLRGSHLDEEEARRIQFGFYQRYRGLHRQHNQARQIARNSMSRTITLPTGIKRQLLASNGSLTPQRLVNTAVQGTAAAGLKHAMMLCKQRGLMAYVGAAVHDELVGVAPSHMAEEIKDEVARCMVQGMAEVIDYEVQVDGKVGKTWA